MTREDVKEQIARTETELRQLHALELAEEYNLLLKINDLFEELSDFNDLNFSRAIVLDELRLS